MVDRSATRSMAGLDLRAEPMVLSVPAIDDRFYHFQFEDLWGHNVHYVGIRATGTGPATTCWPGPAGMDRCPTASTPSSASRPMSSS